MARGTYRNIEAASVPEIQNRVVSCPQQARLAGGKPGFVLLVFFLFLAGCSPAGGYRVTVENRSGQGIDDLLLQAAGKTVSLGALPAAEKTRVNLDIAGKGVIAYRFNMAGECYTGFLDESVSAGQRGNRTLVVGAQGVIRIVDEILHTEVDRSMNGSSQRDWALPCMIPG